VAIVNGIAHLTDISGSGPFIELFRILEDLVQLTARGILKNEVDPRLVVEVAIHAKDVWMAQLRLDVDFALQLVLERSALELRLVENLQADNKS
jgi:hypothetical protein